MNKTPRLSKSGIEYLDYVWNFYSGCWHWQTGTCSVGTNCWAMKLTKRFQNHYPNGFDPTFYPEAFLSPLSLKKPSRIGVCFMGDLFGDWVDSDALSIESANGDIHLFPVNLREEIFETIRRCPQHTFLFLTKQPQNLIKWSPFPDNCLVGFTATNKEMFYEGCYKLTHVRATVKYISFEPLLSWDYMQEVLDSINWAYQWMLQGGIRWVIIGALTGTKYELLALCKAWIIQGVNQETRLMQYKGNLWTLQPRIEWVQDIVEACDKAGIPVFLKNNLLPMMKSVDYILPTNIAMGAYLRQELPE